MPEELYETLPGRLRTSLMKSASVFHGLSARTSSTVGSAVKRANGWNWFNWNVAARPLMRSEMGMVMMLGRAVMTV